MKPMGRNLHGRTHLLLLTATIQAWSEVPSSGVNERGVALGSTFWKPARTSPLWGIRLRGLSSFMMLDRRPNYVLSPPHSAKATSTRMNLNDNYGCHFLQLLGKMLVGFRSSKFELTIAWSSDQLGAKLSGPHSCPHCPRC